MSTLRAGVIGVGYLGQFHAEKYAKMPDVELVGVVDPDQARANQVGGKLGTRSYTDAAKLIGTVDMVSIVAPTVLHHRIAKEFLAAGIHVLLEKPITVTLAEADEIIGLAAARGLMLQIGHIERFNPAVTSIRPLLKAPRYIQTERSAPFTVRCTDVNVVLDLMIHDLDIVSDIAGSPPRRISASGASVITREIDTAVARIVFENGCVADVAASRVSDEKKRILRVFEVDCLYSSDYQAQTAYRSERGSGAVPELVATPLSNERRDTLYDEIAAFVTSVRTGTRPLVTGTEGRQALELAQIITRNIDAGTSEFVPLTAR
jgi:predicted dehydrogenase